MIRLLPHFIVVSILISDFGTCAEEEQRLARGVIPRALIAPEVDGKADDIAWRAPAARLGFVAHDNDKKSEVRVTCDSANLYLLFLCDRGVFRDGETRQRDDLLLEKDDHVAIEFGAAPWLTKRILVSSSGSIRDGTWSGWDWSGLWNSRAVIKSGTARSKQILEIAIPRTEISAIAGRSGTRLALRIEWRLNGRRFRIDRSGGVGILLDSNTAVTALTTGDKDFPSIRIKNWLPSARLRLTLRFIPFSGQAPIVFAEELPEVALGERIHELGWSNRDFRQRCSQGRVELLLQVDGQNEQRYLLMPFQHKQGNTLLNALPASSAVAALIRKAVEQKDPAAVVKIIRATTGPPITFPHQSVSASELEFQLTQTGMRNDGAPDLLLLHRQAASSAHARDLYRRAAELDHIRKIILAWREKPAPDLIRKASASFDSWIKYVRPAPDGGPPPVAWEIDVATARLRTLVALATEILVES